MCAFEGFLILWDRTGRRSVRFRKKFWAISCTLRTALEDSRRWQWFLFLFAVIPSWPRKRWQWNDDATKIWGQNENRRMFNMLFLPAWCIDIRLGIDVTDSLLFNNVHPSWCGSLSFITRPNASLVHVMRYQRLPGIEIVLMPLRYQHIREHWIWYLTSTGKLGITKLINGLEMPGVHLYNDLGYPSVLNGNRGKWYPPRGPMHHRSHYEVQMREVS